MIMGVAMLCHMLEDLMSLGKGNAICPCYIWLQNFMDGIYLPNADTYLLQTTPTAKINLPLYLWWMMSDGRQTTIKDIGGYLNLSTLKIRLFDSTIDGASEIIMNTSGAIKKFIYSSKLNVGFTL